MARYHRDQHALFPAVVHTVLTEARKWGPDRLFDDRLQQMEDPPQRKWRSLFMHSGPNILAIRMWRPLEADRSSGKSARYTSLDDVAYMRSGEAHQRYAATAEQVLRREGTSRRQKVGARGGWKRASQRPQLSPH